jgi:glutaminyl-tRNA synthetase
MYDFSHPIVDALENITLSLCTLEFEDHRPFYEWTLNTLQSIPNSPIAAYTTMPKQVEFSRLNVANAVLSKRKLIPLVENGIVCGWDDPRLLTIAGLRRRGYTPASLRLFCGRIGVSKVDGVVDYGELESAARESMDVSAMRAFCVASPLKVTIDNWRRGEMALNVPRHPKEDMGERQAVLSDTIFIDSNDFHDEVTSGPVPPKYKRLSASQGARLKHGFVIRVKSVVRDPATNAATELICEYDPDTANGVTPEGAKKVGIIHWVDAKSSVPVTIRQYDRLFSRQTPHPDTYLTDVNEDSVRSLSGLVEKSVAQDCVRHLASIATSDDSNARSRYASDLHYQFERLGYYSLDATSTSNSLVFNRVVELRDNWMKEKREEERKEAPARRRGSGGAPKGESGAGQ